MRLLAALLAVVSVAPAFVHAGKDPALPDLLKAADDYLVQYSQKLGAFVAEEEYTQYDVSTGQMATPKRLGTDFIWLGLGNGSVATFRDIVAVDTVPVRAHDNRLAALFRTPTGASLSSAKDFADGTIRYYISPNLHALDEPSIALEFLRKENQERSTFKLEGMKKLDGAQVAVVRFTERGTPRLVQAAEDAPAVGRFWIEPASGAVRQTEIGLSGKVTNIRATVKYAADKATGLLLPSEMYQQIDVSGSGSGGMSTMGAAGAGAATVHQALEGRTHYAKFTQIPVELARLK